MLWMKFKILINSFHVYHVLDNPSFLLVYLNWFQLCPTQSLVIFDITNFPFSKSCKMCKTFLSLGIFHNNFITKIFFQNICKLQSQINRKEKHSILNLFWSKLQINQSSSTLICIKIFKRNEWRTALCRMGI